MDFSPSGLWLAVTDKLVPESQAESLVNQIYGTGGTAQTGRPDPEVSDSRDLSLPAVYVRAKDSITAGINNVTDQIQSSFIKYAIILVAVLLVAGILYGFLPRFGQRLVK